MSRSQRMFIAHSVEDGRFAEDLAAAMSRHGVTVVRDAEVEGGAAWPEGMRREVERASALVLLVPSDTVGNRNNVWFEAGAAKALGKRILAVLMSDARSDDLPPQFADLTITDGAARSTAVVADMLLSAVPGRTASSDPYALIAAGAATKARAET